MWSHLLGDGGLWLSTTRWSLLGGEDGFSGLNDLEGGREGGREKEGRRREGGKKAGGREVKRERKM